MIQIRTSMFETNSSSCHAILISKELNQSLPKTIDLSEDNEIGDTIRPIIRNMSNEDIEKLINFLYCNGVELIKYNGRNKYVNTCITKYKDKPEDMGIPHIIYNDDNNLSDINTKETIINLLMGNFRDYFGNDEYLSDYQDSVYHMLEWLD